MKLSNSGIIRTSRVRGSSSKKKFNESPQDAAAAMIAEHSSILTHDLVKEDIDGEEDAARKVSPVKLLQSTAVVSFQEAMEGEAVAGGCL